MNKTIFRVSKAEAVPADCYDWITAEDVCRHALAAFYATCRLTGAPAGRMFVEDGHPWATRASFLQDLGDHIVDRLNKHAHEAGLPGLERAALVCDRVAAAAQAGGWPD